MSLTIITSASINQFLAEANLGVSLGVIPCPITLRGSQNAVVVFLAGPAGGAGILDAFVLLDPSIDNAQVLNDLHTFFQENFIPCGYRVTDAARHSDVLVVCSPGEFKTQVESVFNDASHNVDFYNPDLANDITKLKNKLA